MTRRARKDARRRKALGYSYYQLLWKSGRSFNARVRDRSIEAAEAEIAVLRCRRALPPATQVRLVWGAGIATPAGVATTNDQSLAFRVRPAFTVRIECSRANADVGCLPMHPIQVVFGAPVARESAMAVRLRFADGTSSRCELDGPRRRAGFRFLQWPACGPHHGGPCTPAA